MKLQGMYVDAATPFDHTGALYRTKVQHNIDKWCRTMAPGVVVGGFAGEGAALTDDERAAMWRTAAGECPKGRLLIGGVPAQSVDAAVKLAETALECGCGAILAETPAFDPSAATQLIHFRALADRSPVPVIVSTRPVNLSAETIIALAAHPNIAGVLDVSGDVAKTLLVVKQVRKDFAVLCGEEQRVWECLKAGASGAILAFGSAAPYVTISIWEAFRTREDDAGLDWQARMAHPAELVTSRYGIAGLKVAMDVNGYYGGPPRLPRIVLPAAARDEIADAFRDLKG